MRQAVVPFGDADLRIRPEVQLAPEHERHDARDVGAEREPLQLVHQLDVLVEPLRECPPAGRASGSSDGAALLDALNPPLDLTHGVDVVGDLRAIAGPSALLQPRQIRHHRVEDAAVLARLRQPLRRRAAVAEQPLEDDARIVLGRQRRRRRAPRQRVQVGAAVAVLALAAEEVEVDRQLQRRQRRVLARSRPRRSGRRRCRCGRRRLRCASDARRSATSSCRACGRRSRRRRARRPDAARAR